MIKAEAHSDDRNVEREFDATQWFEQATDKQILALALCDWRNDYPADEVAMYAANYYDESVAEIWKYLDFIANDPTKKDVSGFECSVNESDAMVWLKENRPELEKLILRFP